MTSSWKLWATAATPEKARRVLRDVLRRMSAEAADVQVEPYPKIDGHVVRFSIELVEVDYADAVVAVLALGQRVGRGWTLSGFIGEELDMSTDSVSVTGAAMLSALLLRPEHAIDPA